MLNVVHTQEGEKTKLSQRRSSTAHALTRICKHTHTHTHSAGGQQEQK